MDWEKSAGSNFLELICSVRLSGNNKTIDYLLESFREHTYIKKGISVIFKDGTLRFFLEESPGQHRLLMFVCLSALTDDLWSDYLSKYLYPLDFLN